MELKRFTKDDWMGYGGAIHFPNKDEPFIAHIKVAMPHSTPGTPIVWDADLLVSGEEPGMVQVVCHSPSEDYEDEIYHVQGAAALNAMLSLPEQPSVEQLKRFGFERIN